MSGSLCRALEQVFEGCFATSHRTRLVGGAVEPEYLPATRPGGWHLLCYRADYPASALHETAHWCIAGDRRRQRVDFGYWYAPDGRDAAGQRRFEAVEARPQALEWHFALAAGLPFRVSIDNLDGDPGDCQRFTAAVASEARHLCERGLPARAERFRNALADRFGGPRLPSPAVFELAA